MNHERPRFSYLIATQLFLRSLGIIYLLAIGSLWVQIEGLLGSTGILPITDYLNLLQKHFSADAYLKAPTLLWICLLYTSPSPRDGLLSRMPSSA